MTVITNPILPGFHPDPSICRAGERYYIAVSTFEWWPGVLIYESLDLVHWRLAARPLDRQSQLDLLGDDDSGGVWAPCLSYADGRFWLVYSNVRSLNGPYKDVHNYVVSAPSVEGPWSEPDYLSSVGFDPSLFHDDDGRKWAVTMIWNHQPGFNRFAGIELQEYSADARGLIGEPELIFETTGLPNTEGPHLLKKDGWYYLIMAEGGTDRDHVISVARSHSIHGPYEVHPDNPILTAKHDPSLPLQKCGHGMFVEAADGSWWTTHLCGRPLANGRCVLGRESGIQPLVWGEDGWPRLAHGGRSPVLETPAPELPAHPWPEVPATVDFAAGVLPDEFQSPRRPIDDTWVDFSAREGHLRLIGGESLVSKFHQSHLARRIQHHRCTVTTTLEIDPGDFHHAAGLTAYYNTRVWFWLRIAKVEDRIVIGVECMDDASYSWDEHQVELPETGPVDLRWELHDGDLRASWRPAGSAEWQSVGDVFDGSRLSDEYGEGWGFTGAFWGLACIDLSGRRRHADIASFSYQPA